MEGFSVAAVTSTSATLSRRALATAVEIDEILKHTTNEKLQFLSAKLQQFRQHADLLADSLRDATFISASLQDAISVALPQCDAALALGSKEVMRIGPDTDLKLLDMDALSRYEALLVSYSRVFIFLMQILPIGAAEGQDAKLAHSDAQSLFANAKAASESILQSSSILLRDASESVAMDGPSSSRKADVTAPPGYDLEPPPFEEAVASAGTAANPLASAQSGFSKGLMSLTNSFKAMTAAMRPKPEPFVSVLCQAASRGNIQQVKGFLDEGANIDGRNEAGNTALISAIINKQHDAAEFLLKAGADHTTRDTSKKKKPPFFHAVEMGSMPTVHLLLARGVDVNETNGYGVGYFFDVVESENIEMITFLLSQGANPNTTSGYGGSVIALAVKKNNMQLAKLLLSYGADVNSRDSTGSPLVAIAANQNRPDMVKMLLSHGADPNTRYISGNLILVDAVQRSNMALAKLLLDHGADPNCRELTGNYVLLGVLKNGSMKEADKEQMVDMLLAHGSNANVSDYMGTPALAHVVQLSSTKLLKSFLAYGANANLKIGDSVPILLSVMEKDRWDQAQLLLRHGANPNIADKTGRTAVLLAMQKGQTDVIKELVQHGADLNQRGNISPFEIAKIAANRDVLKLLRTYGAPGPTGDEEEPSAGSEPRSSQRAPTQARSASPPPGYEEA